MEPCPHYIQGRVLSFVFLLKFLPFLSMWWPCQLWSRFSFREINHFNLVIKSVPERFLSNSNQSPSLKHFIGTQNSWPNYQYWETMGWFCRCFSPYALCWQIPTQMILWYLRLLIHTNLTELSMRLLLDHGPRNMPWANKVLRLVCELRCYIAQSLPIF